MTNIQQVHDGLSIPELKEIDEILQRAISSGDPLIATEYGNALNKSMFLKGISLAKLLYGLSSNWPLFQAAGIGEEFDHFIEAHMLNLSASTAARYINMYTNIFANEGLSVEIRQQLLVQPIRSLLLLTAAVGEGSIDEEKLGEAVLKDEQGIRTMVKEARGLVGRSKTAISASLVYNSTIYPKGTLLVFQNGNSEALGVLNLDPKTEFAKQFLARIKNSLGVQEMR